MEFIPIHANMQVAYRQDCQFNLLPAFRSGSWITMRGLKPRDSDSKIHVAKEQETASGKAVTLETPDEDHAVAVHRQQPWQPALVHPSDSQ
jgi:hypothetical protein